MKIATQQIELRDGFELIHEDKKITIMQDEDSRSPREDDNLGVMMCFHKRYNLGDNQTDMAYRYGADDFTSWNEMQKQIIADYKPLAILPLFLYDHSGITMYTTPNNGDVPLQHQAWDSMQVGFIFTTEEQLQKMGLETRDKKKLLEYLRGEVETYDTHLRGEVYGYKVEKTEECKSCGHVEFAEIDSCWGFYDKESLLEGINQNFEEAK